MNLIEMNTIEIEKIEGKYNEESKRISKYIDEIKDRRREINYLKRKHRFKYKVYFVVIVPLKAYRSALINGKDGNRTIYIDNSISKVERQRELHIILKNKKFIKGF